MSETPVEYRKAMRFQYSKQGADIGVVGILDELEQAYTDVERLEKERDELAGGMLALNAHRNAVGEDALSAMAQLGAAREVLERVRPILCSLAIEVEQKQKAEGSHYLTDAVAVKDAVVTSLAGLSTDTPECGRVFAGYGVAGIGYKCATHHGPWPSDTERCPAAMAGNVTT